MVSLGIQSAAGQGVCPEHEGERDNGASQGWRGMVQGHDMKSLVDLDKVLDCLPKVKGKEHMFRTGGLVR